MEFWIGFAPRARGRSTAGNSAASQPWTNRLARPPGDTSRRPDASSSIFYTDNPIPGDEFQRRVFRNSSRADKQIALVSGNAGQEVCNVHTYTMARENIRTLAETFTATREAFCLFREAKKLLKFHANRRCRTTWKWSHGSWHRGSESVLSVFTKREEAARATRVLFGICVYSTTHSTTVESGNGKWIYGRCQGRDTDDEAMAIGRRNARARR